MLLWWWSSVLPFDQISAAEQCLTEPARVRCVNADAATATDDVQARMAYVRDVLSLHGTDPVEALRARRGNGV